MILVLALAVLLCFGYFVYLLSRNVHLGWACLLAAQFYEFSFGINQVQAGGLHLDIIDAVSFALLGAGILRTLPRLGEKNTARMIGLAYLAVFAFSLFRGFIGNGITTASNEARAFVPMLVTILYFLTAPTDPKSIRTFLRLYFYYSFGLVIIAFLAYAGFHVGGTAWLHAEAGDTDTIEDRLLPSAAAFGIGLCFLFSLAWSSHRYANTFVRWLPPLLLGTAVFLRHRSVWAALIVGTASFLVTDTRLLRRFAIMAVFSIVVLLAFIGVTSLTTTWEHTDTISAAQSEFSDSASNEGTLDWRVQVWEGLLFGEGQTPLTVVAGKPFGDGYVQMVAQSGMWATTPPHSEYLSEYARVGLLGTALAVWFVLHPFSGFLKRGGLGRLSAEPSTSAWAALILSVVVYGVTYCWPWDTLALVGISSAMLKRQSEENEAHASEPASLGHDMAAVA